MKLEEKILALRKQYGMSQEELAGKLNVSRQAISRWEMGTAQPDVSNILQLSKVFCVTTDYLLNDECEQEIHRSEKETGKGVTKKTQQKKIGILILLFGLVGNFVIYIFSRFIKVIIPYITEVDGRQVYEWGRLRGRSYYYFIQQYNLEFLSILFYLCIVVGIGIFFMDNIKNKNLKGFFRK